VAGGGGRAIVKRESCDATSVEGNMAPTSSVYR